MKITKQLYDIFSECKEKYHANVIGLKEDDELYEPSNKIHPMGETPVLFWGFDIDENLNFYDGKERFSLTDNSYWLEIHADVFRKQMKKQHVYLVCGYDPSIYKDTKIDDVEGCECTLKNCTVMMKIF